MAQIKFTKTTLAALQLPLAGKRLTVYDTGISKLALRVTSAGAKTFYVVKRAGTKMAWLKLGTFPEMTVERARDEAQKVLGEFASGNNPGDVRRALRGEPTFEEVFKEYLIRKRKKDGSPLAERTVKEYQNGTRLYLGQIMTMQLSAISHEQVRGLHEKIGKTAQFAANRTKALISAVFSYARDRRLYSGENPAMGVLGFKEEARDRFANAGELPRLFEAMAESSQCDYFWLCLLTGARRSNVQGMAWRDVDLDGAIWRIGKTKNGTPQNVTLSPEAVSILATRRASAGEETYVFPGTGKTGHLVEPKKAWAAICRRAGIDNMRIHDLRRTFGTWQLKTGASLPVIGKSLNHLSQQSTLVYARLDLDPVRQAINTATTAMLEAGGVKSPAEVLSIKAGKVA
jgi:integrase